MNALAPQDDAGRASLPSGPRTPEEERARIAAVMDFARAAGSPGFGRWHVEAGTSFKNFKRALVNRQRLALTVRRVTPTREDGRS